MKYVIVIMLLFRFGPLLGQEQTHYDSAVQMSYCNIVPVKIYRNDTVSCNKIYARVFSDNLSTSAQVYYEFRDTFNILHQNGNFTISDTCYASWQANTNWYVFKFLAYSWVLNLTLQP